MTRESRGNSADEASRLLRLFFNLHLDFRNDPALNNGLLREVLNNNYDAIQKLVSEGANPNAKDMGGRTLLHIAISRNDKYMVKNLIDAGADPNGIDENKSPPLHLAISRDRKDIVELLMNEGANIHLQDQDGYSSLHLAAEEGNDFVVQALINLGADVNLTNKDGKTALMIAEENKHRNVIMLLSDAMQKTDHEVSPPAEGGSAAKTSKSIDDKEPVELVLQGDDLIEKSVVEFVEEVKKNNTNKIKELIAQKADVNLTNKDGKTALMIAVSSGSDRAFDVLLDSDANVRAKDNAGDTALHYAAQQGDLKFVKKLIASRADVNAINGRAGHTPLDFALLYQRADTAKILIEKGSNIYSNSRYRVDSYGLASMNKELLQQLKDDLKNSTSTGAKAFIERVTVSEDSKEEGCSIS